MPEIALPYRLIPRPDGIEKLASRTLLRIELSGGKCPKLPIWVRMLSAYGW